MDSKVVDAGLRQVLWPELRRRGFSRRTGRTAWRDHGDAVQVVNVQSFNSYLADGIGATTFSFALNLGVFFRSIANRSPLGGFIPDHKRPKEHLCQLRKHLVKGFEQPNEPVRSWFGLRPDKSSLGQWRDRPDVWLVLPDGSNVDACVADAAEAVLTRGLPWLDRVSDPREAIRCFQEAEDTSAEVGVDSETYGGALGSPNRWDGILALAEATGDQSLLNWANEEMGRCP
jgi:hypothetical protein